MTAAACTCRRAAPPPPPAQVERADHLELRLAEARVQIQVQRVAILEGQLQLARRELQDAQAAQEQLVQGVWAEYQMRAADQIDPAGRIVRSPEA